MLDEPLWVTVDEGEADMHKLEGIADIIREGGVRHHYYGITNCFYTLDKMFFG